MQLHKKSNRALHWVLRSLGSRSSITAKLIGFVCMAIAVSAFLSSKALAIEGTCVRFCNDPKPPPPRKPSTQPGTQQKPAPPPGPSEAERRRQANLRVAEGENNRCANLANSANPDYASASRACENAVSICVQNGGSNCDDYRVNHYLVLAHMYSRQGNDHQALLMVQQARRYCVIQTRRCADLNYSAQNIADRIARKEQEQREARARQEQQERASRDLSTAQSELDRLRQRNSGAPPPGLAFVDPRNSPVPPSPPATPSAPTTTDAGAQGLSAKYHGDNARSETGEAAKEQSNKVFDTPGQDAGRLPPVNLRGMPDVEIPPQLANDPVVRKHAAEINRQNARIDAVEKELDELRMKKAAAPPEQKPKLDLDEVKLKQTRADAEAKRNFAKYQLRDYISRSVGSGWKQRAPSGPNPAPNASAPPKVP